MSKVDKLSVGIISRNGQPFLEKCLHSFLSAASPLLNAFQSIEYILVDSASTDNTLELMRSFSQESTGDRITATVYLLEDECNAAIARNVILKECSGDIVFLCDGDIEIDYHFIVLAAEKITNGTSDAVVGQLSEKWYDSEFNYTQTIPIRAETNREEFTRIAGGIIMLSGKVVASGIRYDEELTIKEDNDFSLRLSKSFSILSIMSFVGIHHTRSYHSKERFRIFIHDKYHQPLGLLLRKHCHSLADIVEIARSDKGVSAGLAYYLLFFVSSLLYLQHLPIPLLLTLGLFLIDFFWQLSRKNFRGFIMYRFLSPIMLIQGFCCPPKKAQNYLVKKIQGGIADADNG